MRPDGKYLITRRRMDKEWAAGWWEVPGGGVRAGEDSKDAVIREIKEETGIDVTNAEGGYAFSYKRVNPEEKIIILWIFINLCWSLMNQM